MSLLAQFLLRLAFGLAVGMAITSPRQVSSGFFRNHSYVTLGLSVLAAIVSYGAAPIAFWCAIGAAVWSYQSVVFWLYEKPAAGKTALLIVALLSLTATFAVSSAIAAHDGSRVIPKRYFSAPQERLIDSIDWQSEQRKERRFWISAQSDLLYFISNISSGLLLGLTFAAMLLGHWYLNSPGMALAPIRRLLVVASAALVLQALFSGLGFAGEWHYASSLSTQWLLFLALRWSFGIVGVAAMLWMAWQTLKIPNTQSATGILYVAVIGVFIGELAASLLSAESVFPL